MTNNPLPPIAEIYKSSIQEDLRILNMNKQEFINWLRAKGKDKDNEQPSK